MYKAGRQNGPQARELYRAGRLLWVGAFSGPTSVTRRGKTRVLMLQRDDPHARVQILDGEHAGREAWMDIDWLTRIPSR